MEKSNEEILEQFLRLHSELPWYYQIIAWPFAFVFIYYLIKINVGLFLFFLGIKTPPNSIWNWPQRSLDKHRAHWNYINSTEYENKQKQKRDDQLMNDLDNMLKEGTEWQKRMDQYKKKKI